MSSAAKRVAALARGRWGKSADSEPKKPEVEEKQPEPVQESGLVTDDRGGDYYLIDGQKCWLSRNLDSARKAKIDRQDTRLRG
jgi:hypothetical protein